MEIMKHWKWISTIAIILLWTLIMIFPDKTSIRFVATIYTIMLLLFRWT